MQIVLPLVVLLSCISILFMAVDARCSRRPAWQQIGHGQRMRFINAVKALKARGGYDYFVQKHLDYAAITHALPMFLPYHRALLDEFEQAIGVPVPYWDWSADSQAPHMSDIFTDTYFGGNGGEGNCVQDGLFTVEKGWKCTVGHSGDSGCLTRCFNGGNTITPYWGPEHVNAFSHSTDFETFRHALEDSVHNQVHASLGARCGGDFIQMVSPNDVVFWMHHSNVDRIWAVWQKKCKAFGKMYVHSLDTRIPTFGTVRDAMDSGHLCHEYTTAPSEMALNIQCPHDPEEEKEKEEKKRKEQAEKDAQKKEESAKDPKESKADNEEEKAKIVSEDGSVDFAKVDVTNANQAWLFNAMRSMISVQPNIAAAPAALVVRRGLDDEIGSGADSVDLEALPTLYNDYFERNGTNGTNSSLPEAPEDLLAATVFLTEAIATASPSTNGSNPNYIQEGNQTYSTYIPDADVEVKPPPRDNLEDKIHLRYPVPLGEKYLRQMGYDDEGIKLVRVVEKFGYQVINYVNNEADYVSPGSLMEQERRYAEFGYTPMSSAYQSNPFASYSKNNNHERAKTGEKRKCKPRSKKYRKPDSKQGGETYKTYY